MNFLLALMNVKSIVKLFAKFGNFVVNNWKLALVIAITGGIYWKYNSLTTEIDEYANKLKSKVEEIIDLNAKNDKLKQHIEQQNEHIQELVRQGEETQKRLLGAQKENDKLQHNLSEALADIDSQTVPESCKGTMEWMLEKAQKELR